MKLWLFLLAVVPGLLVVLYIYWRDRHDREPIIYLSSCFLFGMLGTYPAIKMEEFGIRDLGIHNQATNWFMTFTFTFAVVAFSEEFVKYIFLRYYIFPKKDFDEPMDGIVYATMIGMGFATLENVIYVMLRANSIEMAFQIGLLRTVTAIPAHAIFAIIMGYFVGWAKFSTKWSNTLLLVGLISAIFLHGLYDFFIFMEFKAYLIWYVLGTGIVAAGLCLNHHDRQSPFLLAAEGEEQEHNL